MFQPAPNFAIPKPVILPFRAENGLFNPRPVNQSDSCGFGVAPVHHSRTRYFLNNTEHESTLSPGPVQILTKITGLVLGCIQI